MYGDMAPLTRHARDLRSLATDVQHSGQTLVSAVGTSWVSTAASRYIDTISDQAREFDTAAVALDEAADALDAHVRAVEALKQAIVEAEQWVTDRWHQATRIANNVIETIEDGASQAFTFLGHDLPEFVVMQAHDVIHALPSLPIPGSKEWLDAADTFRRSGW